MDGFLSGFSGGYNTGNVAKGYMGAVSEAGLAGERQADVTQLKAGDTFQGEIASVNGEDVQIQLANGQYMTAKLARDVQVALGQVMKLQVQSNKDNHIVLKPVYDGNAQLIRVGEAALRAANMPVNDKNLQLVSKLIENGMSIDKNTLLTYNRMSLQNPKTELSDIIRLNKLQLPVTEKNARQLQNYENMEHKILDGVKAASDELIRVYDSILGEAGQGKEGKAVGQGDMHTVLEKSSNFMEKVMTLLDNDDVQKSYNGSDVKQGSLITENTEIRQQEILPAENEENLQKGIFMPENKAVENNVPDTGAVDKNIKNSESEMDNLNYTNETEDISDNKNMSFKELMGAVNGEKRQNIPGKLISYISSGKADIRAVKQFLSDTDIGRSLTLEQKTEIFKSEPFKQLLKEKLESRWMITSEELSKEGKVEELYRRILKESEELSKLMNDAVNSGNQTANASQTKAMSNLSENIDFINQMNQMFNYVQLPLKLRNSQTHGDLYVYTNKKNIANKDGTLSAFLHLDMENLGPLDVSIVLQTEKNQVTTKFYIDEEAVTLVEENIGLLRARLEKKGYKCKNMILEKTQNKTVLEHIEEQVAAGNSVLSYQTFDTRA